MVERPGGALATRPLHFIWLLDCSGSMSVDGKIQALNNAIREAIPHMQEVASENPNAEVLIRAITFSDGAQWHVSQPTPVEKFTWVDVGTSGLTAMGTALELVSEQLKMPPMSDRALPPVLVLISDGMPTDDINSGLTKLMELPWGKKAIRIAIAIGEDADKEILQKFIAHPELRPLQANNVEQLVNYIKWVSTAVLQAASAPNSQQIDTTSDTNVNIPIPTLPQDDLDNAADVW